MTQIMGISLSHWGYFYSFWLQQYGAYYFPLTPTYFPSYTNDMGLILLPLTSAMMEMGSNTGYVIIVHLCNTMSNGGLDIPTVFFDAPP